jgi:hypothetical protein
MAEYKFVDLPARKVDSGGTDIADAITNELNNYARDGWSVVNATGSRILGKSAFLLVRD